MAFSAVAFHAPAKTGMPTLRNASCTRFISVPPSGTWWSGAWKATAENATPPPQYLVYTTQTYEDEHWDDANRRYRVYVYLNLWSTVDPTEAIRLVRAAMRKAGFAFSDEAVSYNDDTRQTLVAWTWVCWEDDE